MEDRDKARKRAERMDKVLNVVAALLATAFFVYCCSGAAHYIRGLFR